MSAAENIQQEKHPENPVMEILKVIECPKIVQVVQDATIASNEEGALRLASESENSRHRAGEHTGLQILNENIATRNIAGAEQAVTEAKHHASASAADTHISMAEDHHTLAHSAAAHSDDSAAKASALEQVSKIQRIVSQETIRQSFAIEEIQNRTIAAVEKEMRATNVVDKGGAAQGSTHDLEAELATTTQANAPKMV